MGPLILEGLPKPEYFIKFEEFGITYQLFYLIVACVLISIFAIVTGQRLKRMNPIGKPSKLIVVFESILDFALSFTGDVHNKKAKKALVPIIGSYLVILVTINILGMLSLVPPASNVNVSLALALISFILIHFFGIKYTGAKHYFKGYVSLEKGIFPLTIFEAFIQPITLALRLTINMFVGVVIIDIFRYLVTSAISNHFVAYPVAIMVSVPFSLFLDLFVGVIQAYVFTLLTASFLAERME